MLSISTPTSSPSSSAPPLGLTKPPPRGKHFINTLLCILRNGTYDEIIYWSADGSHIVIEKMLEFEAHVLSKYYNSSRMDSFSRQLNTYGFKRVSDSRKFRGEPKSRASIFFNPNFHRDHPELLQNIVRQKNPKKAKKTENGLILPSNVNNSSDDSFMLSSTPNNISNSCPCSMICQNELIVPVNSSPYHLPSPNTATSPFDQMFSSTFSSYVPSNYYPALTSPPSSNIAGTYAHTHPATPSDHNIPLIYFPRYYHQSS